MVSGQISDAQISASSYADRGWVAENARLLTGRSGWTGQQVKQPFRNEWFQVGMMMEKNRSGLILFCSMLNFYGVMELVSFLRKDKNNNRVRPSNKHTVHPLRHLPPQVDLGQDKMVSGLVIQGGKHRDRNVFMKRFKVGHSLDGEDWTIIKEDNTTRPKVGSAAAHRAILTP